MGNRACPLCFARVPRALVLTRGDDLACPSCRAPLELSRSSRVLSALAGLLAGFATVHLVLEVTTRGRWIFPMAGAVLTYALASALVLFFASDLVVQPKLSPGEFPQSHK
ncbi:MAG: hypothetical protein WBL63_10935 [Candidatus Acidiferrum sp.]